MKRNRISLYLIVAIALSAGLAAACSGEPFGRKSGSSAPGGNISLQGSGASFPKPIYEKWVNEYGTLNPTIKIDYQAIGSGGGQRAILNNTADFGASDDPMNDEDLAKAESELLHIPTVLGAVVITYNLESLEKPLKLTPQIIASIYMGDIEKWNDPKITSENPGAKLPDSKISPVRRTDSSGTTAVFTDFLARTVPAFKEKIGASKQPNWDSGVGVAGKGNDGVTAQVKSNPNSIGYIEIAFAKANNLPTAHIKNKAGNFVEASIENVSAAAAGSVADMPGDMRTQITNAGGENSYPISSYTYILVYKNQKDAVKGKALVDFLWWATHDGEKFTKDLHYAPLPEEVVKKVEIQLNSISANGKAMRQAG